MTEPKQFPADALLVNAMLTNIRNAQVIDFIKDGAVAADFKNHGLANPWLNLELNGTSSAAGRWREKIAFGTVDALRVAARANDEPAIIGLPREQAILLPKEAFESAFEDFERDCAGHEDEATPKHRCVPMSASRTVASERLEQFVHRAALSAIARRLYVAGD